MWTMNLVDLNLNSTGTFAPTSKLKKSSTSPSHSNHSTHSSRQASPTRNPVRRSAQNPPHSSNQNAARKSTQSATTKQGSRYRTYTNIRVPESHWFLYGTVFGLFLSHLTPTVISTMISSTITYIVSVFQTLLISLLLLGSTYVLYKTVILHTTIDEPCRDIGNLLGWGWSNLPAVRWIDADVGKLKLQIDGLRTEYAARPYRHYADTDADADAEGEDESERPRKIQLESLLGSPLKPSLKSPLKSTLKSSTKISSKFSSKSTSSDDTSFSNVYSFRPYGNDPRSRGTEDRPIYGNENDLRLREKEIEKEQDLTMPMNRINTSPRDIRGYGDDFRRRASLSLVDRRPITTPSLKTSTSMSRGLSNIIGTSSPSSIAIPQDSNRFSLQAVYIQKTPGVKAVHLSGQKLSLRITSDGLELSNQGTANGGSIGSGGGDLKAWMIGSIEYDLGAKGVMRAKTLTSPPVVVTYVFTENERFKAVVGLRALKRELQAKGILVTQVDGESLLHDV
ncbi:uncharacterized protein V1516DRAFT_679895 [Lipomyces oligophaga]|uniref:uncharacterized protein n=1 Tax=Lipomyces oligophaga TaxID=45792 RepID=UPI0034D01A95